MPTEATTKTPTPFYARSRFLLIVLILGIVYSYGWRVTEIDLNEMTHDFYLVKPLFTALIHPDLVKANTQSTVVETKFLIGPISFQNKTVEAAGDTLPALLLSRQSGKVGDTLIVEGFNLKPLREGKLIWVNSIDQEFPLASITTDRKGQFYQEIRVPSLARGKEQRIKAKLTWETTGWHISRTLKLAVDKMIETIFLALMATSLATLVAVPLSFFGARNLMTTHPVGTIIYYVVRTVFNILRSIEPLILAILFAIWVGIGPFAGVLALGFHSLAALGKIYSEQIESIDPRSVEAITATGATRLQVILYAVIPQVVPHFLAFTFYRWDINVRMSTIIGFVGGGGIGFLLQQWINILKYNEAGTALLVIAIVVIILDTISAKVREKII